MTVDQLERNARMYLSRALTRSLAPPDWLTVNLTLQCNLKCTMCTTCYDVPDELSTAEIKALIDQAALWGIQVFNPLGGELFMRGDLEEILDYACRKDFYITVTTNGTLINKRRAEMIAGIPSEKLHLTISFDGPEAVNDSIRGEGMFRRAMKGYENIRQADAAAGNPRRKVLMNTIIHRRNLAVLPDFLDAQAAAGFDGVQLLNLFRHGDADPDDAIGLWIREQDLPALSTLLDELVARVQRQGRSGYRILNTEHDLRLIPSYYRDELKPLEAPCWSGWKELYINSNGDAIMCDGQLDFLAGRFGSARDNTLQELWTSPELQQRRQVVKSCSTPCIQNCYLRRDSDSAMSLTKTALRIAADELKRRAVRLRPRRKGQRIADGRLRLELSDMAPWPAPWDDATQKRFESFATHSPRPVVDCFTNPAQWLVYRDRGYLDFGRGFMGFELVRKVVHDLTTQRITFPILRLDWRGEPLMHPEFAQVLAFVLETVRDQGTFEHIELRTDGRLLSAEIAGVAAAYPEVPQTWIIHDNGVEPYEDAVLRNVGHLAQIRGGATRIVAAHTVSEEIDPHAVIDRWRALLAEAPVVVGRMPSAGDTIWFARSDHDHFQATADARLRLQEIGEILDLPVDSGSEELPRRCPGAFATPTVSWDGKVVLCPWDVDLANTVGQVTDDRLSRIWTQDANVERLRRDVKSKGVPSCERCRDCHFPYSPNYQEAGE